MRSCKELKTILSTYLKTIRPEETKKNCSILAQDIVDLVVGHLDYENISFGKRFILKRANRVTGRRDTRKEYYGYSVKNTGCKK